MKKGKSNKEADDEAPVDILNETIDKEPKYVPYESAGEKTNKKLDALGEQLGGVMTKLDKFLAAQGLGQNARRKVVELINEINAVRDEIIKESD